MQLEQNTIDQKIAIIGLGYVGLPLAIEFAKHFTVIGFDVNTERVEALKNFNDKSREIDSDNLKQAINHNHLVLTADEHLLQGASVFIVTVPTPIDHSNAPDHRP